MYKILLPSLSNLKFLYHISRYRLWLDDIVTVWRGKLSIFYSTKHTLLHFNLDWNLNIFLLLSLREFHTWIDVDFPLFFTAVTCTVHIIVRQVLQGIFALLKKCENIHFRCRNMLYKVLNGVKIYTLFIAMLLCTYSPPRSRVSFHYSHFFHLHLQLRNDAAKQDELDHVPLLSFNVTTNSANCNLQHRSYFAAIEHSVRRARESTQENCKFYRRHLKSLPALLQCNRISLSSHFQLTNEKKSTVSSGFERKLYVFISFFLWQSERERGKLSVLSHHCNHHTMIRWKIFSLTQKTLRAFASSSFICEK